jgi:hypothetical protein
MAAPTPIIPHLVAKMFLPRIYILLLFSFQSLFILRFYVALDTCIFPQNSIVCGN